MQKGYISVKEAADIVGRSARTVILWVDVGRIDGYKMAGQWEIHEQGLLDYIKKCQKNSKS